MIGWKRMDSCPRSQRVLVAGGQRDSTTVGYHDVQCAWVDGLGNVWLDDRPQGASPAHPAGWMELPGPPHSADGSR